LKDNFEHERYLNKPGWHF